MPRLFFLLVLFSFSLDVFSQQNEIIFSIEINKKLFSVPGKEGVLDNKLRYSVSSASPAVILLENISIDTIEVRNLVPFGTSIQHVYITGLGDHELSRTHLFIPGKIPVNVICPDNAWELGFSCHTDSDGKNTAALTRRDRGSI